MSQSDDHWDIVEDGNIITINNQGVAIDRKWLSPEDKKKYKFHHIVKTITM